jgi:hypothetical protein
MSSSLKLELLKTRASVLGFDILIIGRQVTTGKRGRADQFAIERKKFSGIHANQNIPCLLRDTPTVEFLRKAFGI